MSSLLKTILNRNQQQEPQQSAAKQLFKAASLSAGAAAVALITTYEGLRLEAYKDPVGVWTICYGSTKIESEID